MHGNKGRKFVKQLVKNMAGFGLLYIFWWLLKKAYDLGYGEALSDTNYRDGVFDQAAFETGYYTKHDEKYPEFKKACMDMGVEFEG